MRFLAAVSLALTSTAAALAVPAASVAAQAAASKAAAAKGAKKPAGRAGTKGGRWQEIGKTSSGNPVFVDPKSVSTASGITTATVRVEFLEPVDTPKGKYTSARTVAMFDCAKRLVAVKENTYYLDEKRNKVAEHKVVGIPGYGTVIRGALPDVAMQHLCGGK